MWDKTSDSEFSMNLGESATNAEFIHRLCSTSSVMGPKSGKVNKTSTPTRQGKRTRLSLDDSVVETDEVASHDGAMDKYIGKNNNHNNNIIL